MWDVARCIKASCITSQTNRMYPAVLHRIAANIQRLCLCQTFWLTFFLRKKQANNVCENSFRLCCHFVSTPENHVVNILLCFADDYCFSFGTCKNCKIAHLKLKCLRMTGNSVANFNETFHILKYKLKWKTSITARPHSEAST